MTTYGGTESRRHQAACRRSKINRGLGILAPRMPGSTDQQQCRTLSACDCFETSRATFPISNSRLRTTTSEPHSINDAVLQSCSARTHIVTDQADAWVRFLPAPVFLRFEYNLTCVFPADETASRKRRNSKRLRRSVFRRFQGSLIRYGTVRSM